MSKEQLPLPAKPQLSALGQIVAEGLEEAISHRRGDATATRVTRFSFPDVKALRQGLGMSQDRFAKTYRIPLNTIKNWEQNRTRPDCAAIAYLNTIAAIPDEVAKAQK